MNDQELLTYAAKAAGIEDKIFIPMTQPYGYYWNPLISAEDAFLLMVKLNIEIRFNDKSVSASSTLGAWEEDSFTHETKESTVRKMITCAAAEIGKGM